MPLRLSSQSPSTTPPLTPPPPPPHTFIREAKQMRFVWSVFPSLLAFPPVGEGWGGGGCQRAAAERLTRSRMARIVFPPFHDSRMMIQITTIASSSRTQRDRTEEDDKDDGLMLCLRSGKCLFALPLRPSVRSSIFLPSPPPPATPARLFSHLPHSFPLIGSHQIFTCIFGPSPQQLVICTSLPPPKGKAKKETKRNKTGTLD